MSTKDSIYFPGLNGIRAIAAIIVLVFHTDEFIGLFGLKSIGFWTTMMHSYAVVLFFVLSGYLITYLLLKEKQKFNKIDFRKFYTRRILRIWPVYYMVLAIGILIYLLFPIASETGKDPTVSFTMYAFFIPNVAHALNYFPLVISILWSVGAEEQFYSFWPLLINSSKKIFQSLIIFLLAFIALKIGLRTYSDHNFPYIFLLRNPFDSMAIGGIAAYFFFTNNKALKLVYLPAVQIGSWLFFIVSIFHGPIHVSSIFDYEIHSIIYAILILNVSTNTSSIIKLEGKLFSFIGRISYGVYAYHMIVVFLMSMLIKPLLQEMSNSFLQYGFVFSATIICTIGIAYLSYNYFESSFLKMKVRFMLIKSGNTTQ